MIKRIPNRRRSFVRGITDRGSRNVVLDSSTLAQVTDGAGQLPLPVPTATRDLREQAEPWCAMFPAPMKLPD